MAIWNIVLAHHALDTSSDRGAGECASLIDQLSFGGNQFTFLGCAQFNFNLGSRSRSCALKHFDSGQLDLNRSPCLAGEKSGYGLHVGDALGTKTTTNFHGDCFDVTNRDSQEPGCVVTYGELALAAGK